MLPGKKLKPEDLLAIVWRRKWCGHRAVRPGDAATVLVSRSLPNRYRSETLILVVPQRVPESYVRSTVTTSLEDRLRSIQQQILSRTRLEQIIRDCRSLPVERASVFPMEDVVELMRARRQGRDRQGRRLPRDLHVRGPEEGDAGRRSPGVRVRRREHAGPRGARDGDDRVPAVAARRRAPAAGRGREARSPTSSAATPGALPSERDSNLTVLHNLRTAGPGGARLGQPRPGPPPVPRADAGGLEAEAPAPPAAAPVSAPADPAAGVAGATAGRPARGRPRDAQGARAAPQARASRHRLHEARHQGPRGQGRRRSGGQQPANRRARPAESPARRTNARGTGRAAPDPGDAAGARQRRRPAGVARQTEEKRLRGRNRGAPGPGLRHARPRGRVHRPDARLRDAQAAYADLLGKQRGLQGGGGARSSADRRAVQGARSGAAARVAVQPEPVPDQPDGRPRRARSSGFGLVAFLEYRDNDLRSEEDVLRVLSIPVLASIPRIETERWIARAPEAAPHDWRAPLPRRRAHPRSAVVVWAVGVQRPLTGSGSDMYESFFGLRERPFDLTPNPRFIYLSGCHLEALSVVHYGIVGRKGITLVVGEAGTGKTTVIRTALEAVAQPTARCVYLSNPTLTRAEFYEFLAASFGLTRRGGGVEGAVPARVRAAAPPAEQGEGPHGAGDRRSPEPVARAAGGGPPAGQPRDADRQAAAGGHGRAAGACRDARPPRTAAAEAAGRAPRRPFTRSALRQVAAYVAGRIRKAGGDPRRRVHEGRRSC